MRTLSGALFALVMLALLAGCAGPRYASYRDRYDAVKIDQMLGNNVSAKPLQRTLVCLGARRETRELLGATNVVVTQVTNVSVVTLTNQTVTVVTNVSRTQATNIVALPPASPAALTNEAAAAETNVVVAGMPPNSTNEVVTTAQNLALTKAGNQASSVASLQTQLSRQVTISSNNVSVTTADNQTLSAETNLVLTTVTNLTVVPVTNVVVLETNLCLREYFLIAEYTPPADFTLQPGESLVLLVDGVRHVFAPTNSPALVPTRKGFVASLYRVPPEVLVDIANARKVELRLRGTTTTLDRTLSKSCRQAFKKFLLRYFVAPEPDTTNAAPAVATAAL